METGHPSIIEELTKLLNSPAVAVVLSAIAGYFSYRAREDTKKLKNGEGEKMIDARLEKHGLIEPAVRPKRRVKVQQEEDE